MSPEERQQHDAMDDVTEDAAQDDSKSVEQVCGSTIRGCCGRLGWRSRALGGARLRGEKRAFTMPLPSGSRGVQLGMLRQLGVVAPPGQAGGEAREKHLVPSVMDAVGAVQGCRPADMSRRGISSL
jgi:hypothetical protein